MRVNRGEIFGLLGPNGAGKSTLVKILMTVINATRCEGTLLSQRVGSKAALRRVGYLPEHHRFPDYLTGRQVLDHFGAMSDVPRETRRKRSAELLPWSAWTRGRTSGSRGIPRACASGLGSRSRSSTIRTWCSSMSRPTASIRWAGATSATCCRNSNAAQDGVPELAPAQRTRDGERSCGDHGARHGDLAGHHERTDRVRAPVRD